MQNNTIPTRGLLCSAHTIIIDSQNTSIWSCDAPSSPSPPSVVVIGSDCHEKPCQLHPFRSPQPLAHSTPPPPLNIPIIIINSYREKSKCIERFTAGNSLSPSAEANKCFQHTFSLSRNGPCYLLSVLTACRPFTATVTANAPTLATTRLSISICSLQFGYNFFFLFLTLGTRLQTSSVFCRERKRKVRIEGSWTYRFLPSGLCH